MRVMALKEWRRNAPTIWSFPRIVGRYYSSGRLGFTAIPSCPSSLSRTWEPVSKPGSIHLSHDKVDDRGSMMDLTTVCSQTAATLAMVVLVVPTWAPRYLGG